MRALGLLLLLLGTALGARPVAADPPAQAALVVQSEGDRVASYCLDLPAEGWTGADLILNSGLDVVLDSSSGMGVTVCKLEGVGCDFPGGPCFCRCMGGGECRYWNYYYRDPDQAEWTYSPLGAILRQIQPGSAEAWVWGDGHTPPSADLTFDAICAPPAQGTAATPTATSPAATIQPPPTSAPTMQATAQPTAASTAAPPQPTATAAPGEGGAQPPAPSYLPFGLTLLALLVIGVLAWLRLK